MNEKLDVGRVLSQVFESYRAQAGLLLPAAAVVFVVPALIGALILTGGASLAVLLLPFLIFIIASFWFQGMVVEAVRDIRDGRRDFSLDGLFRSAMPVIAPLIGAGILAGIGIAIGFFLLIVPGLILLTIWALIAPVIVIERAGVLDSFARSRELVRGNGWNVFGVIVVLFILQAIVSSIFQSIGRGISDNAFSYGVANWIGNVLVAPLSALAATIMYFDLRGLRGDQTPGR